MAEAPLHPHNVERRTFLDIDGVIQPAPAPRYSATVTDTPVMTRATSTDAVLADCGVDAATVARLRAAGAIA
ncbi:MAG TPA: CoA transferase, partial [Polymorphobacter sp.]|nr:CoA transferase [Polymorphobacter sp.]